MQDLYQHFHFMGEILPRFHELTCNTRQKFIQIGTNDGIQSDWLRPLVIQGQWSGMMIEPHPEYFRQAKDNYRDLVPGVIWLEAAISTVEDTKDLYYVKDLNNLPYQLKGIASFDLQHLIRHRVNPENIDQVSVPCLRLDKVLDQYDFWDASVLVIDVEGHEMAVLDSCDFSRFRPRFVVIETQHLPMQDRIKLRDIFRGYVSVESRTDTLFYLQ